MAGTITALVSCQIQACATEVSYPLDMVRMYKGEPICEECYLEGPTDARETEDEAERWFDLPEITLKDLKE